MNISIESLAEFVKRRRKQMELSQARFARNTGVALTVLRKIEQGHQNVSLAKVNQVLNMFGHTTGAVLAKRKPAPPEKPLSESEV